MRLNLTLYLTAFVASTGVMAMPIPNPKPINPDTVSDVGRGMKDPKWKNGFKPLLKKIAVLATAHQLIIWTYPWVLDTIHDMVSDGYDEEWLAQFDGLEEAETPIADDSDGDSEEDLPGGEVAF